RISLILRPRSASRAARPHLLPTRSESSPVASLRPIPNGIFELLSLRRDASGPSWYRSARAPLGKQEPPKPGPACRNCVPIGLSSPMPRATSWTSADLFGEIGDLVDEGDLGGEERVRRIFDQRRAVNIRGAWLSDSGSPRRRASILPASLWNPRR